MCKCTSWMRHLAQARNPYSLSWLWIPGSRFARPGMTVSGLLRFGCFYPSNTASAPFTASALSMTVRSSEAACTEMFSAKNRASVT